MGPVGRQAWDRRAGLLDGSRLTFSGHGAHALHRRQAQSTLLTVLRLPGCIARLPCRRRVSSRCNHCGRPISAAPPPVALHPAQDGPDAGFALRPRLPSSPQLRDRAGCTSCTGRMLRADLEPAPLATPGPGHLHHDVRGCGALPIGLLARLLRQLPGPGAVGGLLEATAAGPEPRQPTVPSLA